MGRKQDGEVVGLLGLGRARKESVGNWREGHARRYSRGAESGAGRVKVQLRNG